MSITRTHLSVLWVAVPMLAAFAADAEPPDPAWRTPVLVASGNAFQGPWLMNASEFDYVDDPTVAVLDGGEAAVAWVDQSRKDVLFQRFGPGRERQLPEPVNVSRSPGIFSWLPRISVAPEQPGTFYVLWQEIVFSGGSHGGEIFFSRSDDGGRSFSDPINLSRTEAGAGKGRLTEEYWHNGSLDLAVGPDGTLYAAWTEYQGPLRLARSTDGGDTFSAPRRIAGGSNRLPTRGPSLAAGPNGRVHLAWTVGGDASADIRYAGSTDGGITFGDPVLVGSGKGHADAPKLALDDAGTLHLVFTVSPDGPLGDYEVRYARQASGTGGFGPARRISRGLPEGFDAAGFPHVAAADGGRLYVLFELFRESGRERPRGLGLVLSRDGGNSFTPTAVVPGTADPATGPNGGRQGLLMRKLDAGPGATIAVVNSSFKRGESSSIRLYRAETDNR